MNSRQIKIPLENELNWLVEIHRGIGVYCFLSIYYSLSFILDMDESDDSLISINYITICSENECTVRTFEKAAKHIKMSVRVLLWTWFIVT